MKRIFRGNPPLPLVQWKAANARVPQNLRYDNLSGTVRDSVKNQMLEEQGYLCGYTMLRIKDAEKCHIEHIVPQNQDPALELEFTNMLACFPTDGGNASYGYGAPVKGGAEVTPATFVSPLNPSVENRFKFRQTGEIEARADDDAAERTIKLLALDHPVLTELRRQAILAAGLSPYSRKPVSAAEARRRAGNWRARPSGAEMSPFCIALADVADEYASRLEARAQRMRKER